MCDFFKSSPEHMFEFRERGRETERQTERNMDVRKTHPSVASPTGSQPRYVP